MNFNTIWNGVADVEFKQYYINANNIKTRILEAGQGEPLILLHGTGGHIEAYARNIKGLSEKFKLFCVDMVGHGYSDKPDTPYTIDYYSAHLEGVIDALGYEKVFISGESLGGWVAAWFGAQHPERVKAMVLTTPGNVTNDPEVMNRLRNSTVKAVEEANYDNVRTRLEWLMYDKEMVTDELVQSRYQIYTQPEMKKAVHNIVVLQDIKVREQYTWSPSWCNKISIPTLLLWTDHDPTASVDQAYAIQEMIPGSELIVIKDAGHWPQWEKPEEFDQVHFDFLLQYK